MIKIVAIESQGNVRTVVVCENVTPLEVAALKEAAKGDFANFSKGEEIIRSAAKKRAAKK